jgi:hypothetical protein
MRSFFLRIIISLIIGFFFILIIYKFVNYSKEFLSAVIAGNLCALFYVVSGFFSYYYASHLKQRSFTRIFLISVTGRFLLVIILITLILKFTHINKEIYIISFFIWYFVFQILEVLSLNQIITRKI